MRSDDFREELLSAKKAHQLALRENSHFRTRLRIAESECRRREAQIESLLKAQANDGTAEGKSATARMEIASLRRKVMLYERMLHEKSAENEKLMSDKCVSQAAETRKMINRLESECQRLRTHLAQSVPESEFLREKEQYTAIINKLVEENMHLRSVIGEFEQRRKESERIITQLGGSDALVRQFRQTAISSRRKANFYRKALGNLIKRKGNGSREIVSVGQERGRDGEERQRLSERQRSENDSSKQSEKMKQNSSKNKETEEEKMEPENDQKEMMNQMQQNEKEGENNVGKQEGNGRKRTRSDQSDRVASLSSRSSSTPPASISPRGAALPPTRVSSTESSSRVENNEEQREEEEEEEKEEGDEKEEEERDEEEEERDEEEIEESQLNALFRVLHSHILRQQMLKVRRERDECPNLVGMGNFY